jgi:cysteinyl-tRNA synthetase
MSMAQPLTLYNSLTRSAEPFRPIDPDMVRLYSCGPTVYSTAHLGNLRAYVFTDTLRRALNWKGYATTHVINITDVGHLTSDADAGDDKMELAARAAGETAWDVAARYTALFKADLKALNILDPSIWSVATDHVQDMIAFARTIEAHSAAYEIPDKGLYLDVRSDHVHRYGALARSETEAADGGGAEGRIDLVEEKRQAADFALWRRSAPDERRQMEWQSPWGPGAPGWHLECSVMSMKYLGRRFDIHTGGIDHREIHHVNEIAQNQAFTCTGDTGANWWMHNNFVVDRTGKMSKSKGGVATLGDLVARGVHPLAYRLLCLSSHYRSELEFSFEAVAAALTRLKRLVGVVAKAAPSDAAIDRLAAEQGYSRGAALDVFRAAVERDLPAAAGPYLARFDAALADDLNTPVALTVLDAMLADAQLDGRMKRCLLASFDAALGLDLLRTGRADLSLRPETATLDAEEVEALLADRQAARAARDFATADAARDRLGEAGVEIMDGDAARWEWRPALAD